MEQLSTSSSFPGELTVYDYQFLQLCEFSFRWLDAFHLFQAAHRFKKHLHLRVGLICQNFPRSQVGFAGNRSRRKGRQETKGWTPKES